MTSKRLSISACFPAFNDGGTIASMVAMAMHTMAKVSDQYEVIVCNDGSRDFTQTVLDELARLYPNLIIVQHSQNSGYGSALRSAFAKAQKDFIFYTDGDAQYDVRELEQLVAQFNQESERGTTIDIVNGYKISRNDPWHRVVVGRIYQHTMRLLFGFPIRDVDCDFRLMRRSCLDAIQLESTDGTLPLELVKKLSDAGCRFTEVPVHHFHRVYGRSQFFNVRRLLRVVRDVSRLWVKLVWRKPAPDLRRNVVGNPSTSEH